MSNERIMVLEGFQITKNSQIEIVDAVTVRCLKGEMYVNKAGCTGIAGAAKVKVYGTVKGVKLVQEDGRATVKAECDGVEVINKVPPPVKVERRDTGVSSGAGCSQRVDIASVMSQRNKR